MMTTFFKKYKLILYILLGGIAGYSYYYFIGCYNGTCAIQSNPYFSTGYGVLTGFILGFDFRIKKKSD